MKSIICMLFSLVVISNVFGATVRLTRGEIICENEDYKINYNIYHDAMVIIIKKSDESEEVVRTGDDGYNATITYLETSPQIQYAVRHHEDDYDELVFIVEDKFTLGLGIVNSFGVDPDKDDPFDIKGRFGCYYKL